MVEDSLDMQSTDFALILFSAPVQSKLLKEGFAESANFCQLARDFIAANDDPAIPALERLRMKIRYDNYYDCV